MSTPTKYTRSYSFSGYQATNPSQPLPAPQVDNELENIEQSLGEAIDAVNDVRRADGALVNGIVTVDSLASEVRDQIGEGATASAAAAAASADAAASSADASASSAAAAAGSATAAQTSANSAAAARNEASTFRDLADSARTGAQTARDFAAQWASAPENTDVDDGVNPVNKSAYHWAKVAQGAAEGNLPDGSVTEPKLDAGVAAKLNGALQAANGLSDLPDIFAARKNIGLMSTKADATADTPSVDPEYYDIAYFDTNYQAGSGAKYRKRASDPGTPDAFQNGNGTWYSIDTWIKTPQMFGLVGSGGDDSAVFAALNDPGLVGPIFVPAGTYIMEDVTVRRWMNGEGPGKTVIKHKANSSTVAFQIVGSDPLLSNLTVDGDKDNQPSRPTLVTGDGGKFSFDNVSFENSVYAGVHLLDFVTANFKGCTWTGMAYHGGTTGQQTMCAVIESSDKAQAIFEGCKFINLGSPSLRAPGGVLATHKNVSMIFKGNYFYRIGQGEASNFIGCIDAYQEGIDNVIVGNIFEEICYSAAKLSSSKHNVVADNIINVFDSGDSTAVPAIVIAFRPTDQITQKVVVKGNVIGGTIGTGKSGIEVYGASGSNIQNVLIEGNIVKTSGRCIMAQYADVVKILNNDVFSSADANPVRTLNLANALVDIRGNTITCGAAGISIDLTASDGSSGAIATIADNTIISLVAWSVALRLDGIARARMSGNTFNGFGTSTARLYNIAGNIVAIGNLTDGNTTLDTTGSSGDITDVGNTWNA